MSNITTAVGVIALVIVMMLIVAAYPAVFGSVHEDAVASGVIGNASVDNTTYTQGENVAKGFMGLTMATVYIILIVLVIVVWLIMFSI